MLNLISASGHSLALPPFPCRIGTASTSHVLMQAGLGIAGHHLTILAEGGQIILEDSGSGLGTFVDGLPITRQILRGGEILKFGQIELKLELPGSAPPIGSPPPLTATQSIPMAPAPTRPIRNSTFAPPKPPSDAAESPPPLPPELLPMAMAEMDPPLAIPSVEMPEVEVPAEPSPITLPTLGMPPAMPITEMPNAEAPAKPIPSKIQFPRPSANDEIPKLGLSKSDSPNNSKLQRLKNSKSTPKGNGRVWVRALLGSALLVAGGGALLLSQKPEWKQALFERFGDGADIAALIAPKTHLANSELTESYSRMAGTLISITRPAAVVTIDVEALRAHDHSDSLPRLKAWLSQYLKIDLADIDRFVAVGASSDEFSMALETKDPLPANTLTERLGEPDAKGSYHFGTLYGAFALRAVEPRLLIVGRAKAIESLSVAASETAITPELKKYLTQAKGRLQSYLDGAMVERGNLPFFLADAGPSLTSKYVSLNFEKQTTFEVEAMYSKEGAASAYAGTYTSALQSGLTQLAVDQKELIDRTMSYVKTTATQSAAKIHWKIASSQKSLVGPLIEMIADPLGAEVAPASVDVLRQEAQRVAALYHTARSARAPLDDVKDVMGALSALIKGVQGADVEWKDRVFQTRVYSMREREVMRKFLDFSEGTLTFRQNVYEGGEFQASMDAVSHAESLSSIYAAAQAAEADLSEVIDVPTAVSLLAESPGVEGQGTLEGERFHYRISESERFEVIKHLKFDNGQLIFAPGPETDALMQNPQVFGSETTP